MRRAKPKLYLRNEFHCAHCGVPQNAFTSTDNEPRAPEPGDVTVCIMCGEFNIVAAQPLEGASFTVPAGKLTLRKPTDDELVEMWENPEIRRVREAWVQAQKASQ
jgi:hypothetical protein